MELREVEFGCSLHRITKLTKLVAIYVFGVSSFLSGSGAGVLLMGVISLIDCEIVSIASSIFFVLASYDSCIVVEDDVMCEVVVVLLLNCDCCACVCLFSGLDSSMIHLSDFLRRLANNSAPIEKKVEI